jgi:hypothetical protein
MSGWQDVIAGRAAWSMEQGDCLEWLRALPDDSIDLLMCSPPYEQARLYLEGGANMGIARDTEAWVAWMVEVVRAASPKVKGLIAVNCEGQTREYRYTCSPYLLMADLCRAGFNCRRPVIYHRVGIPGSGGPDWLRCDYEPVVCVTRPGRLPWSDNTACGHPPKWAPGGEMSHRVSDGTRVNQWGKFVGDGQPTSKTRKADGSRDDRKRPSHQMMTRRDRVAAGEGKTFPAPGERGKGGEEQAHIPPALANPGNLVGEMYTADEVAALLAQASDMTHHNVGGGQMGSRLSHENEAPFPETLAEFFVRSFCPENGIVLDPFSGSGTTGAVSVRWGRRFVGCDLRQSQVDLSSRRIKGEQHLFMPVAEDPT